MSGLTWAEGGSISERNRHILRRIQGEYDLNLSKLQVFDVEASSAEKCISSTVEPRPLRTPAEPG
jgi:hypothetical protein